MTTITFTYKDLLKIIKEETDTTIFNQIESISITPYGIKIEVGIDNKTLGRRRKIKRKVLFEERK
jgi:hypothetical protein